MTARVRVLFLPRDAGEDEGGGLNGGAQWAPVERLERLEPESFEPLANLVLQEFFGDSDKRADFRRNEALRGID
jgi:hypothetical protein